MTQDEIIEMGKQAGLEAFYYPELITKDAWEKVQAFAKLVAEKEREACANLCWKNENDNAFINAYNGKRLDLLCSELIRARGKA